MSALVESMFSYRETPWHNLGNVVQDAPTSADAIRLAGLEWDVVQEPLFLSDSTEVPNIFANVRSSDRSVLGTVSDRYKVVQNLEAFNFMDGLCGNGVTYETAGALKRGKVVWLLVKITESMSLLGDAVDQYVVLTNSHDGTSALKVAITPIRVVCNNTLTKGLREAVRTFSMRHCESINGKMAEAEKVLMLTGRYAEALKKYAEQMTQIKIAPSVMLTWVKSLFPIEDDATDLVKARADTKRGELLYRYNNAPDLANFRGTAWGAYNALTDFAGHSEPSRMTATFKEGRFLNLIENPVMVEDGMGMLMAMAS